MLQGAEASQDPGEEYNSRQGDTSNTAIPNIHGCSAQGLCIMTYTIEVI